MPATKNYGQVDVSNFSEIVKVYRTSLAEIARWERVRDELNSSIKDLLGEGDNIGLIDGKPVLKKTTIHTSRFDTRKFRDEFPELADKYMIPGTYARLTVIDDT